ncbi:OmpA family protein [Winogradskyella eckloniae]|uniref:OmpA family protein n=1 Tax=Winogradskyella eckloniae TaxID=1089306 RepID=UPI001566F435|nr:OmpA family protein [Winogradskyella eckloniae]
MSQNLVLNPSFEDYKRCPEIIGQFSRNVTGWSIPNLGSTDFFSTFSKAVGSHNYIGYQMPKDGKSYAGFYAFSPDNYREYIQGELNESLQKGKTYTLTFYISLAENSTDALKGIQVLFNEQKLVLSTKSFKAISETYINPKKQTNKRFRLYSIDSELFYNDRVNWTKVSLEFIAEGYETHFSIGNFNNNRKTELQEILKTTKVKHQFSYYYIDEVSIVPSEKEEMETETTEIVNIPKLKTNEIYTFKNVLFNIDKAELLEESIEELNQLYSHLKSNPSFNVEIYGHTDSLGLENRNKELSEERGKAVAEYLILQGLNTSRIESFGLGSSQPIASNDTEEGRQQNRRVTFKIIE